MTIQLIIFIIGLAAVIFFCKNFNATVYFVVMVDIFLRIITYLKISVLQDNAFGFLNLIPADLPSIVKSFNLGVTFDGIIMAVYIVIYIIFEIILISKFVKKKY